MNLIQKLINFFKGNPTISFSGVPKPNEALSENPLGNPSMQDGPIDDLTHPGIDVEFKILTNRGNNMSGTTPSPLQQDAASLAAEADAGAAKLVKVGADVVGAANTIATAATNVAAAVDDAEADAKAAIAVLGPVLADGEKFCALVKNGVVTFVKSITEDAKKAIAYIHSL